MERSNKRTVEGDSKARSESERVSYHVTQEVTF